MEQAHRAHGRNSVPLLDGDGNGGNEEVEVSASVITKRAAAGNPDDGGDSTDSGGGHAGLRGSHVETAEDDEVVPEGMIGTPAIREVTDVMMVRMDEEELHSNDMGENVVSWIETLKQAQQRQLVLSREDWPSRDLYYWSVGPPQSGSSDVVPRESAWEVQLRLIQRRQQSGELLRDYANSLTELGAGHPGLSGNFYVDAFARGMNNKISAQVVRTVKSPTLQQAVSFAIENCGKYGEVNNWDLAAQMHQKNARTTRMPLLRHP
ncbi:hypothetical protein PC121_g6945 [Phytophthora cactorum]|nr:hypothetical protein PC121_g6945 [Phytophthora cactorum]